MTTPVHTALLAHFVDPPDPARPTPLFWWSGADLDRVRLAWHLDQVVDTGVGGTIVGYSHLPDGRPDAASPAPFSAEWWTLFAWYVDQSAARGLTVGMQDYNFVSEALRETGRHTSDLHGGTLDHVDVPVLGPGAWTIRVEGVPVAAVLVAADGAGSRTTSWRVGSDGSVSGDAPAGDWTVCVVTRRPGVLRGRPTSFDPLHPQAGRRHIQAYYAVFAEHLGDRLGTSFTTFFQDELDLGVQMPMVDDQVLDALTAADYPPDHWLAGLWHDLGPRTAELRSTYRDIVVSLLEEHYFRPVYEWNEAHGTQLCMDQLSRGDLRAGRRHYGDYAATMRWYHGPGNDDPDLRGPRSVAAFKVSASLAALDHRPLVFDEAFYGSGWGVTPGAIRAGLDQAFALGANHIALHGLYYTTEGGWWEWASPDFHHRQPWWPDADALWSYVGRVSAVLRSGVQVCTVAVLDPTEDLEVCGEQTTSPEVALQVLTHLAENTIDAHLLPRHHLVGGHASDGATQVAEQAYRVIVVPAMSAVRPDTRDALCAHLAAGGVLVVLDGDPRLAPGGATSVPRGTLHLAPLLDPGQLDTLAEHLRDLVPLDVVSASGRLLTSHRRTPDGDVYFLVNPDDAASVSGPVRLGVPGRVEQWDAHTGRRTTLASRLVAGASEVVLDLAPGASALLVVLPGPPGSAPPAPPTGEPHVVPLTSWTAEPVPSVDNRYGDHVPRELLPTSGDLLPVATWHVEVREDDTAPPETRLVGDGRRFWVLGPVADRFRPVADDLLAGITTLDPSRPVDLGGDALQWRSYSFSLDTGVADDPMQLDRNTGPHGLKGVVPQFLDVDAVDPDAKAGTHYYFWTTVQAGVDQDTQVSVSAGSRAATEVWLGGRPTLTLGEQPVVTFPPWDLLDREAVVATITAAMPRGRHPLLARITTAAGQPSRAHVVVSTGDSLVPSTPTDRQHLPWWRGPWAALEPEPDPGMAAGCSLQVAVPPGARSVRVLSHCSVLEASLSGRTLDVIALTSTGAQPTSYAVSLPPDVLAGSVLQLTVPPGTSVPHGAGALAGPLVWDTTAGPVSATRWTELGLADFSGRVVFRTTLDREAEPGRDVRLVLRGLVGSARIAVDGRTVATVLEPDSETDLTDLVTAPGATLEITTSNTLVNVWSRLPSPYADRRDVGGGFATAALHVRPRTPDQSG